MIELTDFAGCPPLDDVPVFTGFARAVLARLIGGRVWRRDGAAHALHGYGMSLVWGGGVGQAFPALIAHLNAGTYRDKDEWLQIDPRWGHLDWEGQLRAERFDRVNFRFDRAAFAARYRASRPAAGWRIADLRENAFNLCGVHVSPHAFWKDYRALVAHGGGVVAEIGGEVGALAFAATRFDDWLEIGIETREAYRGQGLARAVAVAMIQKCLNDGLTPVWACRKQNTGSLRLAQSLGFVVTKELPFWRLVAH